MVEEDDEDFDEDLEDGPLPAVLPWPTRLILTAGELKRARARRAATINQDANMLLDENTTEAGDSAALLLAENDGIGNGGGGGGGNGGGGADVGG